VVLQEFQGGVVGPGHASDATASADKAWTDINGVGMARFHVQRREWRERAWLRQVVVGGVGVGARAWVEAGEEETPFTRVSKVGGVLELALLRQDEL